MLLIISDHNDSLPSPSYYSYHQPYSVFSFFFYLSVLPSAIHEVTAPFSSTVESTVSLHWGHCVSISEQGFALHNLLPQFGQVIYILILVIILCSYSSLHSTGWICRTSLWGWDFPHQCTVRTMLYINLTERGCVQ